MKQMVARTAATGWFRYVCTENNDWGLAREAGGEYICHLQMQNLHMNVAIHKLSEHTSPLDHPYIREFLPGLTVLEISPSYLPPCSKEVTLSSPLNSQPAKQ